MQAHDSIDRVIERYVEERKRCPLRIAQEHFLSHAALVCRRGELQPFMQRTRGLLLYYIDSISIFDNPLRNARVCWLLLTIQVFTFSLIMLVDDELRLTGLIIGSGSVIFGSSLWTTVWNQWLDADLLIACYREMIDLIDRLNPPVSSEPDISRHS